MHPTRRLRAAVDRRITAILDAVVANRRFLEQAQGQHELDHEVLRVVQHQAMAAIPEALAELATAIDRVAEELRAVAASRDVALSRVGDELEDVRIRLRSIGGTTAVLAEHLASLDVPRPEPTTVVSVIVATRDRADVLPSALASVRDQTYPAWECVVVDDGSTDDTPRVVAPWLDDPRFRYLRREAAGAPAARNAGIAAATGSLVAYLDSDNTFAPSYLARVVDGFHRRPSAEWSIAGQIVLDDRAPHVRDPFHPLDALDDGNFIDLNSLVHRRDLVEELGPLFDEELLRLSDWALVRRLAGRSAPLRIPAVGSYYEARRDDRISTTLPFSPYAVRIRREARAGRLARGLRVLLAEWHFPQLTESYVRTELEALQHHGAEVEVWSQESELSAPYPIDVPVHHGALDACIDGFRPHVVLTHWANKAVEFQDVVRGRAALFVARIHGFDFDVGAVDRLLADPAVVVHTFPHLVDPTWAAHERVVVTPSSFNEDRYRPAERKDRRLVLRTAAGLDSKDLEVFLETAKRCPDHRFVLVLGHALRAEHQTEELIEEARRRGSPCEILVDVQHAEMATLMARAGIYLHTHGTRTPMGMSISISEAMATGCFVLARDLPGVAAYLGGAGERYDGADVDDRAEAAATLIRSTTTWSDDEWRRRWRVAVERAHGHFASSEVVAAMLRSWKVAQPSLPIG